MTEWENQRDATNSYRGLGEIVYRNADVLGSILSKLEPMDQHLFIQYVESIDEAVLKGEDHD